MRPPRKGKSVAGYPQAHARLGVWLWQGVDRFYEVRYAAGATARHLHLPKKVRVRFTDSQLFVAALEFQVDVTKYVP